MSFSFLFQYVMNRSHTLSSKLGIYCIHIIYARIYHRVDILNNCNSSHMAVVLWVSKNQIGSSAKEVWSVSSIILVARIAVWCCNHAPWAITSGALRCVCRSMILFISFVPGYLSLGVVARSLLDERFRGCERHISLESIDDFSVSDCRESRTVWGK